MIEEDISIESDGASLSGTLCLPALKGSFPIVLMIHGSGPLDRNENTAGQRLDIFNTIAHTLAAAGIASVRYDKRGCFGSTGNYHSTSHRKFVADAVRWVEVLHRKEFCRENRIYLLGHSEGSVIAPQVHSENTTVAGLILLCPFVTDFESMLLKQASQLDKDIVKFGGWTGFAHRAKCVINGSYLSQQKVLLDKVKASNAETIRIKGQTITAKWLREMLELDFQSVYRKITCPTLLIGGGKDLQCDPKDVLIVAELCGGPVKLDLLTELTHVLRFDDQEPALTRYSDLIAKPVEDEVIDIIIDWLICSDDLI